MRCQSCGAENRAGRKFCAECATPLAVACPTCGSLNQPRERFCGECAAPLVEPRPAPADEHAAVRPTAQRRVVSVLFADLVGFTTLSEERDPEQVRDILTRYFESTQQVIARYGGEVEKFIGDAVMAVWGTPTAHEDDAERAVRAAMELVEAVRGLELGPGIPPLSARAAVLTGEAAVTLGASGQGMVAGDLVNTASRLQSVAKAGSVLVDESTRAAASGAIHFEAAGEHLLKGRLAPVPAWRADRVVAMVGGLGRTEQLEPPFVGRDAELRMLKDMLHATAADRRARLVSVIGGAGMGKSRLGWEFHKYIDGLVDNIYWHQGRSPSYGEGITFWALGEMVRKRAGLAEQDDAAVTRAGIAGALAQYVADAEERRWIEPRLLQLLGVESGIASDRDELFAAWRTFFEHVAALGPTVMLFEDLHWADPGVLDFIEHLLDRSRNQPILIITMARPELFERRPTWGSGRGNFVSVTLEPLSGEALAEGIEGLVPGLPRQVVADIVARADGVPLYAVETIRMLIQQERIVEQDGVFQPTSDLTELDIPQSLHALIAARIDSLVPADQQLVTQASVLGLTFAVEALAALADESTAVLGARLRGLVEREFFSLNEDPRSPERGQYSFVHRLTHEVAYGRMARPDRRALHLAAARYFETLDDEEIAAALAMHYLDAYRAAPEGPEGEAVGIQARIALRAAAERAISLHSHEQALTFLEHGLMVTKQPFERAALLERAAESAMALVRFDDARSHAQTARSLYEESDDRPAVARATALLGRILLNFGLPREALEVIEPALEHLADLHDDPAVVALMAEAARGAALFGLSDRAIAMADRALVLAEQHDLLPVIADAVTTKGVALGASGRIREASILMRGVLRLAEEHGLRSAEIRARMNMSMYEYADDPRSAMGIALVGAERAAKLGSTEWEILLSDNAALCALPAGEWDWIESFASGDRLQLVALAAREGLGTASVIRAWRGLPVAEVDDMLSGLEESISGSSDPQDRVIVIPYRAAADLATGHWQRAVQTGLAIRWSEGLDLTIAYRTVAFAGHAATALGDAAQLRSLVQKIEQMGIHGRWAGATRQTLAAGLSAIEGDQVSALALFGQAMRTWRALDLRFETALTAVEMTELLDNALPDVRSAGDEGRGVAEQLGAVRLLSRFDAARGKSAAGLGPEPPRREGVAARVEQQRAPARIGARLARAALTIRAASRYDAATVVSTRDTRVLTNSNLRLEPCRWRAARIGQAVRWMPVHRKSCGPSSRNTSPPLRRWAAMRWSNGAVSA